jgi:hypothetical protein
MEIDTMKTLFATLTIVVLAAASAAQAQDPGTLPEATGGAFFDNSYGARIGYHASTIQEGIARGLADQARSAGLYNQLTSEAALNLAAARRAELQNAEDSVDAFYSIRQKTRAYRAAERRPRLSRESLARVAEAARPGRLTSNQLDELSGEIAWPLLLQSEAFDHHRAELEELFSRRAENGRISGEDFLQLKQVTEALNSDLKDRVHHLPLNEYATAKRFLKSVAYEAQLPVGPLPGIAGEVEGR